MDFLRKSIDCLGKSIDFIDFIENLGGVLRKSLDFLSNSSDYDGMPLKVNGFTKAFNGLFLNINEI